MKRFQNILAIDTALNGCGVAYAGLSGAADEALGMKHGQAEHLVPMIDRVLKAANAQYKDIDAIITTVGPGAFTGLRIGLSTAKALALSLAVPVFGITTLQAIALDFYYKSEESMPVMVALDTKRGDYYAQDYDSDGKAMNAATLITSDQRSGFSKAYLVLGDGIFEKEAYSADYERPNPSLMIEHFNHHPEYFSDNADPFYLRGADVSQSKRAQRIIGT